jgi:hypothetical protein
VPILLIGGLIIECVLREDKRMKATIDELLLDAQKRKASDLHLTVGISPRCRVNGEWWIWDMIYSVL